MVIIKVDIEQELFKKWQMYVKGKPCVYRVFTNAYIQYLQQNVGLCVLLSCGNVEHR